VQAGTTALSDGDLRLALERFEAVVLAFPDRPEGHNNLGALYSSIGEFAKAEQCFDRVLEILPNNPNILFNRGVVRSSLEKFDAARADFHAVLEITPDDPDTINNLGVAAFMQGHWDEARNLFRHAVALKPDYVNAFLNHVDLECTAGKFSLAIEMCEAFLATNSSIEVRRKHLELLSSGCRDALAKAGEAAESILVVERENDAVREELGRITQAKAAWGGSATCTI
jgi:Flp pilus assembly protein TadD